MALLLRQRRRAAGDPQDLQSAARYAQQRGVVIVAAAGNEAQDLGHPTTDDISPDWPPDTAVTREVRNNCRVAPAELPGVVTVSASGVDHAGQLLQHRWSDRRRDRAGWRRRADARHDLRPDPGRLVEHRRHRPVGGPGRRRARGRGRQRRPLGLDQRDVHGIAPRGRRGSADPSAPPRLEPGCRGAQIRRSATPTACPADWPADDVRQCTGGPSSTTFFGAGMVNALNASSL